MDENNENKELKELEEYLDYNDHITEDEQRRCYRCDRIVFSAIVFLLCFFGCAIVVLVRLLYEWWQK